jgi:hypothetical protein
VNQYVNLNFTFGRILEIIEVLLINWFIVQQKKDQSKMNSDWENINYKFIKG